MLLATIERGLSDPCFKEIYFLFFKKGRGGGMRERVTGEGGGA